MDIMTPNMIELKGQDKATPMVWDIRHVVDIVREYCGFSFADGLEDMLLELQTQADYTNQKLNTDLDCYEADIGQLRGDIIDAIENLSNLISKVENGELAFSKQKIMPVIKQIKQDLEYSV